MLKIGDLTLRSNVLLAPLAGISDSSFRLLCRQFGASFTFVEMINARAISHKNKKTKKMLETDPMDTPIGIQLLGAEVSHILPAMDVISSYHFDLLDFNAACPVRKVCRRNEGAALLKDVPRLKTILSAMAKNWKKPVTVKIRSGWNADSRNAADVARAAQDAGIRAIFIHGRDRQQFYKGQVDYAAIAAVKKSVDIPVIASGDIWSALHAKKMFDETGCDGILVARGCLGNPWIFRQIEGYFSSGRIAPPPETEEILSVMQQHLEMMVTEHGEKNAVALMRKFVGWYLKGRRFVRSVRQRVNETKDRQGFLELIAHVRELAR
ncbi:MAG: tRNA dihydrouridine synthase DusB [Candidatus Omnitrophica bacterium]|nr:tRNA dihydrouridine synthase DusB [Candidatus Omnitrophota bacterium]MDD5574265.1 tRNA dihydrouridine synthase DusB [Candidatus Omnitrophota bacterium]